MKTKCIFVTGRSRGLEKPPPLVLCSRELPYVTQADHLGHIITEDGTMEKDAAIKRAKFIDSSVKTREMFHFAAPQEIIKAMKLYNNAFYGSKLWNFRGEKTEQVFSAWNTAVKLAWGCPQPTRTYIVQQILCCGYTSARTDLMTRFVSFFKSLRFSSSREVCFLSKLLARDVRSTIGRNLNLIADLSRMNPWTANQNDIRDALIAKETVPVPVMDKWRLPYLCSLLSQRSEAYYNGNDEEVKILSSYIGSLVTN